MSEYNVYKDIAERTGGEIYIGVVGPVRTGKSTFIKKFMDLLVIPNIENGYAKEKAKDELPISGNGKTIMTTEPEFIPDEAVSISLGDSSKMKVKMIDCVGYIVDSALGHTEDDAPRMVMTPWSDKPMEFALAAETGTKKVICDHSTIGLVVTTDGSFTDIKREDYIDAEKKVISELKEINKPFVIMLNTKYPKEKETENLRAFLEAEYGVPVICTDCSSVTKEEINDIMKKVLYQFPLLSASINLPSWISTLPSGHRVKTNIYDFVLNLADGLKTINDTKEFLTKLSDYEYIEEAAFNEIDLGKGTAVIDITVKKSLYYEIVKELSGFDIESDDKLLSLLKEMSLIKSEYEKIKDALSEVSRKGYGIVTPSIDELSLEEPEIVKQGGRYGVRLRASAPSIHMIRADIETEVSPIVGTEKQSEDLVRYLLSEFETDPKKIWESNIFGKSLHELVNEGLKTKLNHMPDDAQVKLQETLTRIINEGSGGLICIIL